VTLSSRGSARLQAAVVRFLALSPAQRRIVHEQMVGQALARWQAFAEAQGVIRYREHATGTEQFVDASVLVDAVAVARSGDGIAALEQRFREPIVALQDGDLSFPESVTCAYYAIYNFFRKYALQEECDDLMLLNQAGSSDEDEQEWEPALVKAIERAADERWRTP
jgi:hypothetical protein